MAGYKEIVGQAKYFWETRSLEQKRFLLGGAAATLLLLGLLVWFLGAPDYKTLYTGLDPADAQALGAQLDAQQIPHQTSPDGKTISVPADKLDAARLQTAAQGAHIDASGLLEGGTRPVGASDPAAQSITNCSPVRQVHAK